MKTLQRYLFVAGFVCLSGLVALTAAATSWAAGAKTGLNLEKEGEVYAYTDPQTKTTVHLQRTGQDVFLLSEGVNTLLGQVVGPKTDDPQAKSKAYDVLVFDLNFDGTPEFLLKTEEEDGRVFYGVVDATGTGLQASALFAPKGLELMSSLYTVSAEPGLVLVSPVLNPQKKQLECNHREDRAVSRFRFAFENGRYELVDSLMPLYTQSGLRVAKHTLYSGEEVTDSSVSSYEQGVKLYAKPGEAVELREEPRAEAAVGMVLEKGRSYALDNAIIDADGQTWLHLTGSAGKSGWVPDATSIEVFGGRK